MKTTCCWCGLTIVWSYRHHMFWRANGNKANRIVCALAPEGYHEPPRGSV